jgi:ATP-binding cassette subfamily F protein 3
MIILDEPTNHLDIDSRAALAEAINDFPGAIIMVSHDRYLIESCADQLWVVANQTVTTYDGDLDDYRRMVLSIGDTRGGSRERSSERAKENLKENNRPERSKNEKRTPLKQRIAEAEAEIERINGIIAKIDTALALPDLFTRDPKQAAQLSKARAGAESALRRAEEVWLEASSQYDEAAG